MQKKIPTIALLLILFVCFLAVRQTSAFVTSRTYTTTADFDEGLFNGVQDANPPDQLQLTTGPFVFPFIWVPNYDGTVSKLNTTDGAELGRYRIAPPGLPSGGDPSRTTVDQRGNCWVGMRQAGTVVKIGLFEKGEYIDRNHNGIIETSHSSTALPWGQDECVLYEVVLIPGHEGTYDPGTYPGPYDTNYWGPSPRGLAIDKYNNLWAGTWSTSKYYYISGTNGQILNQVDLSNVYGLAHYAYGAAISENSMLWSSGSPNYPYGIVYFNASDPLNNANIDPSMNWVKWPDGTRLDRLVYGLGLDSQGNLFASEWTNSALLKINTTNGRVIWEKSYPDLYTARGVVCTLDDDVWVASTNMNWVVRYDNDGNFKARIPGFNQPTGVAVDKAGEVWGCDLGDDYVHRINQTTNTIDLSAAVVGSGGHYTYSDMTGFISGNILTKIGTWTVVFDSGEANTPWGTLSWHSQEPSGTAIAVRAASSEDGAIYSPYETALNEMKLTSTPNGRYLKIEATLQILSGDVSPVLYDLTAQIGITPDVAITDVTPDSNWVYQGKLCHAGVNVTVKNLGAAPEDFTVTLYALNDTATPTELTIGTQQVTDLLPNGTLVLRFEWNSADASPCHWYNITAVASVVPGEINTANNVYSSPVLLKVRLVGDVNGDGKVDIKDIALAAKAFGESPGKPRWLPWGPYADIDNDGKVDIFDVALIAKNFGRTCS